ncbi:hypothetical protein [Curtobacterium aetherium]|uniref:hypothetical protein n=1 Tax=Curtobacterium aetherium TaxID=2841594 RepID=UPI00209BACC6|nr:hypothetical protein [Curtobacterium sp. L6-1]
MTVTVRVRLTGRVHVVDRVPWRVGPRGAHAGDGLAEFVAEAVGRSTERIGGLLDLDRLTLTAAPPELRAGRGDSAAEVRAVAGRAAEVRAAAVRAGVVRGIRRRPSRVVAGFADLRTRTPAGRRTHLRLFVVDGPHRYVVEGVQTVAGGLRTRWRRATTLHTVVVRLTGAGALPTTEVTRRLAAGDLDGEVVLAGVLRVRWPWPPLWLGLGLGLGVGIGRRPAPRPAPHR